MKKIFAIALALVMVLSMASAFAINNCSAPSFGWPCDTEIDLCGKGAVEVVPYVKINSACDSWAWEANTCAGAVNTEKVYYAIKMTVEANADPAWWGAAYLTVEVDGLSGATTLTKAGPLAGSPKIDWAEDEDDVEYYLAKDLKSWIAVEDWEDLSAKAQEAYIFSAKVVEADSVEVCATLESYNSGIGTYEWNGYDIDTTKLTVDANGVVSGTMVITGDEGAATYTVKDGEVTNVKGSKDAVEDANATFGLGCGWVCVTDDALEANFGWDDEQEACATWSDKVAAIVDAECVVAIPKTGDASVLAWLF